MAITPEELKAVHLWLQARLEGHGDDEPPGGPQARSMALRLLERASKPQEIFNSSPLSDPAWLSGIAAGLTETGEAGPGACVGVFEIKHAIGAGGMGTVYLAQRVAGGFNQRVALKILAGKRPGKDSIQQFQREREVLSRLEHTSIARLIDGGITADGRPWFAMEYVDGQTIDHYANSHRLSIEDRLQLFLQTCAALEYAHGQLVLHRDIKPSNILVTDKGQVKLLDFGLGKIQAGLEDAADSEQTQAIDRWMTPEYASPEQVEGESVNVASEVYQLGLLLYRLLCEKSAYAFRDEHPSAAEIVCVVRDTEPTRPSEKWRERAGDTNPRSHHFQDSPGRLHKRLKGDLDNIVLTALAKQPDDRYTSVAEFSEDIRRHLEFRPIRARAATRAYLLGKFLRRYRAGVAVAAVLAVVILTALTAVTWQARVAAGERDVARVEANRWDAFNDQLLTVFRQASNESASDELSARELLQGSVDRVDLVLADDPAGQARLKAMLGMLYRSLQDFQTAGPLLEAFAKADDDKTPASLRGQIYSDLADVRLRLGDAAGALDAADHAVSILESRAGDHSFRLSSAYQVRGRILRSLNRWDEALLSIEHGVELSRTDNGKPNRNLASALNNLAVAQAYAGRTDAAMLRYQESLQIWQALGMESSNDALNIMGNLAALYFQRGHLEQAEQTFSNAIEFRKRLYGPSGALAALHNNFGLVLHQRHRLDEARTHLERALEMQRRFAGPTSPDYAFSLRAMGMLELGEGHPVIADDYLRWAETLFSNALGDNHLFTVVVALNRAEVRRYNDPQSAADEFEAVAARLLSAGPAADPYLAELRCQQAMLHVDLGNIQKAVEYASACDEIRSEYFPGETWQHIDAQAILAAAQIHQGDPGAREHLEIHRAALEAIYGPGHPRLIWLDSQ